MNNMQFLPLQNWDAEINNLEAFFSQVETPAVPVKLDACTILHPASFRQFIDGHLTFVKIHNGNIHFLPYLERLQLLKQILTITNQSKNAKI